MGPHDEVDCDLDGVNSDPDAPNDDDEVIEPWDYTGDYDLDPDDDSDEDDDE
jgi:hypothetical protein